MKAKAVKPATARPSIAKFIARMNASITRSPLIKVAARKTGRHVDLARFAHVGKGCDWEVLDALLSGVRTAVLNFSLRESALASSFFDDTEGAEDPALRERQLLYRQLENLRRAADLARRETGIYALWMGYPLLHVPTGPKDDDPWMLAPVFLFPAHIRPNTRREGQVHVYRAPEGHPRFNTAMAAWLKRNLNIELPPISADDLTGATGESLAPLLRAIGQAFQPPIPPPAHQLVPVPTGRALSAAEGAKFHAAAVLGIFRWQNESILADLQEIDKRTSLGGLVRAFVEGEHEAPPEPPAPPDEEDRYLVTDADFSQQRVIWRSRAGPGLVVHGPPGTGKSQTIVNIVADALAHGQTVLMVCQKEAATRVVMQRLRAVGLDGLCVELHDPEAERQGVFKEILRRVNNLQSNGVAPVAERRRRIARQIHEIEQRLDSFARAVHEPHPASGASYRDVTALEGSVLRKDRSVRALPSLVEVGNACRAPDLHALVQTVERLGDLFVRSNYLENLWRHRVEGFDPSGTVGDDVRALLARCAKADREHQEFLSLEQDHVGLPTDLAGVPAAVACATDAIRAVAKLPSSVRHIVSKWIDRLKDASPESIRDVEQRIGGLRRLAADVRNRPLDAAWQEALRSRGEVEARIALSASRIVCRLHGRWWRFMSRAYREAVRSIRLFRPDALGASVVDVARECLAHMDAVNARRAFAAALQAESPVPVDGDDEGARLGHAEVVAGCFPVATQVLACTRSFTWTAGPVLRSLSADTGEAERRIEQLRRAEQQAAIVSRGLEQIGTLRLYLKDAEVDRLRAAFIRGTSIGPDLASLDDGLSRLTYLRDFEGALGAMHGERLRVVRALMDEEARRAGGVPDSLPAPDRHGGRWWGLVTQLSVATAWKQQILTRHPILTQMSADHYDRLADELRQALHEKRKLEVPAILNLWQEHQSRAAGYPWQALFRLRGVKGSPALKLREAVHAGIKKDLFAFAPCWLTNPSAAAQVFPLVESLFDVVVFDEASQCPLEQALPSLFRAGRAVIAGDEKQLPPTSFFAPDSDSQTDEEPEEEHPPPESDEAEDARVRELIAQNVAESEDLLSAAVPMLAEEYLRVHYRSEHPALIEFSNRAFYSGKLEAPPARALPSGADPPIRFVPVSGVYESRRRVNRAEAAEVVKVVKAVLGAPPPCPTLGVVTFNLPQRDLIQDMLEEERARDPRFAARYEAELDRTDGHQDVSLFVKNLENVQGDERDVMVFSTTFGRNESGRFLRLFGPVGQLGGERRLNVAVTRAKRGIFVVSSMPIEEISPAVHAGVGMGMALLPKDYLHFYLSYARSVSSGDSEAVAKIIARLGGSSVRHTEGSVESVLEEEVAAFVESLGYEVRAQVGDSGFRIDLAVVHPTRSRGYVLGIECDGATYHADRSARLRDVWRQAILENRGWRIHRVWSTRWWNQRSEEADRLKFAIEEAIARAG